MKKIAAFHLYNDFSGSPKALKTVLEGLLEKGCQVDLITSEGGVLDGLTGHPGLVRRTCRYAFSENRLKTTFRFVRAQMKMFFMALKYLPEKDIVFYVNTLMPLGAALAGRMTGKKVIYHYHENAQVKGGAYPFLCRMMQILANRIVCVSAYQRSFLKRKNDIYVVPNALDRDFINKLNPDPDVAFDRKSVLMLSSLKAYKGIPEYFLLAEKNPHFSFVLVINDIDENIQLFLQENNIAVPENIIYYPKQDDVTKFYNEASIVLNLSNKDCFVETFGLTALEAMANALPVIVPPVGGIAEMVEDGVNGYRIDIEHLDYLSEILNMVLSDKGLYVRLATAAYEKSQEFSLNSTVDNIECVLID